MAASALLLALAGAGLVGWLLDRGGERALEMRTRRRLRPAGPTTAIGAG